MAEFLELINNVGFPIAMVFYFIYDKNKTTSKLIETQSESTKILSEALNSNTKSIYKNSTILEKLLVKLGVEDLHE